VRNPPEFEIVRFEGAMELPLGELAGRLHTLEPDYRYVLVCHSGGRAAQAYQLLKSGGFEDVAVLAGGIDAWAERVQTDLARYR